MKVGDQRRPAVLFGVPFVLSALAALVLRPSLLAPVAPLAGPWAGNLYGHSECTLARAAPAFAYATTGVLVAALAGVWRTRGAPRRFAFVVTWFAALAWYVLALLSVLNTKS